MDLVKKSTLAKNIEHGKQQQAYLSVRLTIQSACTHTYTHIHILSITVSSQAGSTERTHDTQSEQHYSYNQLVRVHS